MTSSPFKTNGLSMEDGDLTGAVIGCAMRVHTYVGCGFLEFIYQNALEIEMRNANIKFTREYELPIFYYEHKIGSRRVDFLVEERINVGGKSLEVKRLINSRAPKSERKQ